MVIYLLFFLSGASGLIYQVIWVRQFGNLFGNTTESASLVTGVFMFGLGVGSYLAGKYIDKKVDNNNAVSALKYYGNIEIIIAVLGLLIALSFSVIDSLSPLISHYTQIENGWFTLSFGSYIWRYVIALVLLTPITILMGSTLTLLIKFLLHGNIDQASWKIGLLYGINTAGAGLGCLLVDTVFIPYLGLFSSQCLAILFNLIAGFCAIKIKRTSQIDSEILETQVINDSNFEKSNTFPKGALITLLFIIGFSGMGIEIVWFRYLSGLFGNFRFTFSILLSTILISMWIGSTVSGLLSKRIKKPVFLLACSQALFIITVLTSFMFFDTDLTNINQLKSYYSESNNAINWILGYWFNLRGFILLISLPSFFMGASFPLANTIIQDNDHTIGKDAGMLYLFNTLGGVAGSLTVGFILLPIIGSQNSIFVICLLSFLVLLVMFFFPLLKFKQLFNKPEKTVIGLLTLASILLIYKWSNLRSDYILSKIYARIKSPQKILTINESTTDSIAIAELTYATKRKERVLYVDGKLMSGTLPGPQRYMRGFTHIPLLHMEKPEDVLIICFGVGNTAQSTSLYPSIKNIEIADLSQNVLNHGHYFEEWNLAILKDPKVSVFINDGRQHLKMQKNLKYDLITLEPPPIATAGMASLYSEEFYKLAKMKLKKDGFMTQWLPAYQVDEMADRGIIKAFLNIFPNTIILSGFERHLILMGSKSDAPIKYSAKELRSKLGSLPLVKKDLRKYHLSSPTEFFGTFSGSANHLQKNLRYDFPITDDDPYMEYSIFARLFQKRTIPKDIFDTSNVSSWCPTCSDKKSEGYVHDLQYYLELLGYWYASENFLVTYPFGKRANYSLELKDPDQHYKKVYEKYPYLRAVLPTSSH
jgi:spermidine synthase